MTGFGVLWILPMVLGSLPPRVTSQTTLCQVYELRFVVCMTQFQSMEQGDDFWQDVCSDDGRTLISDCILVYSSECPKLWIETSLGDLTRERNLIDTISNTTCEINTNQICDETNICFNSVLGTTGDLQSYSGLLGFYTWFCGQNHIQKIHDCLETANGSCPNLVASLRDVDVFQLADGTYIPFSTLETRAVDLCQRKADASCLNDDVDCAADPLIDLANEILQCSHTDQTRRCLAQKCNLEVANFFIGMFNLLECGTSVTACPADTDDKGREWSITKTGFYSTTTCQMGYSDVMCLTAKSSSAAKRGTDSKCEQETGQDVWTATRECTVEGTWDSQVPGCTLFLTIAEIQTDLTDLENSSTPPLPGDVAPVLVKFTIVVDPDADVIKDADDVTNVIKTLTTVTNVLKIVANPTLEEKNLYLDVVDRLLDVSKDEAWTDFMKKADVTGATVVLEPVDKFLDIIENETCNNLVAGERTDIIRDNVYVSVGKTLNDVTFPASDVNISGGEIHIAGDALANQGLGSNPCYGGAYYHTIAQSVSGRLAVNRSIVSFSGKMEVVSDVASIQFRRSLSNMDPAFIIKFTKTRKGTHSFPRCVSWDFTIGEAADLGAWSTEGCVLVNTTGDVTYCQCDHLTNFAVLMSIGDLSAKDAKVLSIISLIGCAISIVGLLLTISAHWIVWRLVRSDRAVILMNLCGALLIALIVFLAGINRVESEVACKVIAACLHYIWLVVFCIMLLEGIEILICVVHVFVTRFRIRIFLPIAWLVPAIIVGISLGITKTDGYGNDKFCWLDIDSGLIWAFVGPAAFVILVNIIVIIVVFRKMSTAISMKSKNAKVKVLTVLRSLCVLLPVMGVTWVLGIASVNEDMIALQYLFCIFNSLQGLLIFLFHCVFNRQIRDALKRRQDRKRSLQTFSSDLKKQMPSDTEMKKERKKNAPDGRHPDRKRPSHDSNQIEGSISSGKYDVIRPGITASGDAWERSRRKEYHRHIRNGRSSNI